MSQHGYPERLSGRSKALQEDGLCQPTIEILVESLTGSAFQMTVSPHDTIYAIKTKIFRVEGIPMSQQHLLYNLKELDDSASLNDYSIKDGCTLKLVLSIRGGPISTRRLPLPAVEDLHWRDIRDFVDNNRDEALEWLPPGCKVLVFRDGDNVNLVKVIEDDDDEHYTAPTDYSFSDETAVTMCKMIDLRCKMEKLSMKRNKKKQNSRTKLWLNMRDTAANKEVIKRTTSEENISSTLKGVFDETPNFTKYKYGKVLSNNRASDDSIPSYPSMFNMDGHGGKFHSKNDKFGLWQPIGSCPEGESASSRTWRTSNFLRDSASTSSGDYYKSKADCTGSTESFKDSILAGTINSAFGNATGGKCDASDLDGYREPSTSKEDYLGEAGDLLDNDVIEQSNPSKHNSKVVTTNVGGSGPGGVVLETSTAPPLPLTLLATHSPNTAGDFHEEYRVAQLLSNDRSSQNADPFKNHGKYYFHQSSNSNHIKRVVRKVVFGSNSQLNGVTESRSRTDLLSTYAEPVAGPSHTPTGSEPQIDQLKDLNDDRIPKKNTNLSNSISNLFMNSQSNNKLNVPSSDNTWGSGIDKQDGVYFKRASSVKPMVFSSSTSDLLGLKRNKILPSLSRHPNCERLDVSDESLHKIDVLKRESSNFQPNNDTSFRNVSFGMDEESPSPISWTDPGFSVKAFGTNCSGSGMSDSLSRESSRFEEENLSKNNSVHNIRFMHNEDYADTFKNNSSVPACHYSTSNISRRNLEVGSERRCRRVKKILKLDHNNLQDHKNRLDGVSRRHFLLGYGGQGYEASIQKMPNNCLRIGDKPESRGYSQEDRFTPLYERCVNRNQEVLQIQSMKQKPPFTVQEPIQLSPKLLSELKTINSTPNKLEDKPYSMTQLCDSRESSDTVVLPVISSKAEEEAQKNDVKKTKRMRCAFCKKRLTIASIHTCRCGVIFCAPHRYAEVHGCQYDYKAEGQEYLRRANPLVSAPKLPKI